MAGAARVTAISSSPAVLNNLLIKVMSSTRLSNRRLYRLAIMMNRPQREADARAHEGQGDRSTLALEKAAGTRWRLLRALLGAWGSLHEKRLAGARELGE